MSRLHLQLGANNGKSPTASLFCIKSLTEQLNIDFLKRVDTAELIEFMVNLVEDEGFVIVCSEVLHYIVH